MGQKRFWEIDFLRGIAIVMMIAFHVVYNINYFNIWDIALYSGFWFYFARAAASLFILLVGVSLTLSFSKRRLKNKTGMCMKYIRRGLKIFSWGLFITVITWLFFREYFILFGILHFIGISIILAYPFIKYKFLNLFIGIGAIIIGLYVQNFSFDFPWLLWLGFVPRNFYTFDYFPIFPWFGLVLIGLFVGNVLYTDFVRRFKIPELSCFIGVRFFSFLGRHSLLIYLVHQPILFGLLWLLVGF